MSRSYTVLTASLIGVAGLVAIAQVTMSADAASQSLMAVRLQIAHRSMRQAV